MRLKNNREFLVNFLQIAIICLSSFYGALYLELFYESYTETSRLSEIFSGCLVNGALIRLVIIFSIFLTGCFLCLYLAKKYKKLPKLIFKYRYIIGVAFLSILVIFEINGSSIASLAGVFGYDAAYDDIVFGNSRGIRSDEFSVYTPMCISQTYNDFDIYNSYFTGYPENISITYGSPTLSAVTVFRPFLWGYILFGAAKGLSFFWCARFIFLFLISFDFSRIITHDNKVLSFIGACFVTFSPMIQWWYGIGFTVEIVLYGELLCICLYYMLSFKRYSLAFAAMIPYFCGAYIFSLYPAWQVPCFYVFALIGICFAIKKLRSYKNEVVTLKKKWVFASLGISSLIFLPLIGFSLFQGYDAINAIIGSVYPGKRLSTGGGLIDLIVNMGQSTHLPLAEPSSVNQCEYADFSDIAPFAIVIGVYIGFVRRDYILVALSVLCILFVCYGVFGVPDVVSKVTLFSYVPTKRLLFALGLLSIFMLIRALSLIDVDNIGLKSCFVVFVLFCLNIAFLSVNNLYLNVKGAALAFLLVASIFAILWHLYASKTKDDSFKWRYLAIVVLFFVALPGFCINPVQKGIDVINELPESIEIGRINVKEEGTFGSNSYNLQRLCPYNNAKVIGVQVYPLAGLWEKIDPQHLNEEIWNRYAHITFLIKESGDPEFSLIQSDYFQVTAKPSDLKKLGIDYYLLTKDENNNSYILDKLGVECVGQTDAMFCYKF